MIQYIVLIIVACIVILTLYYYHKENKYEAEKEAEKAEKIWELQRMNLQTDLREANDLGAFKSYEGFNKVK